MFVYYSLLLFINTYIYNTLLMAVFAIDYYFFIHGYDFDVI